MKVNDFKKLYEYVDKDSEVYIITKGLKFNPITEVRTLILSEIEKTSPNRYLKLCVNVTGVGHVKMNSLRTNSKKFNSYLINRVLLDEVISKLNLSLCDLIASKDILIKKVSSINSSLDRKLNVIEKQKSKVSVVSKNRVDDDFKKWIKSTRAKLYKNVTKSENMVFKKLSSAFGRRVKKQKPFVIDGKSYFADIYIKSMKLIIEVDGGYHKLIEQQEKDEVRDKAFASIGYTTIRITNEQAHNRKFMQEFIQRLKDLKTKNLK